MSEPANARAVAAAVGDDGAVVSENVWTQLRFQVAVVVLEVAALGLAMARPPPCLPPLRPFLPSKPAPCGVNHLRTCRRRFAAHLAERNGRQLLVLLHGAPLCSGQID